MSDSTNALSPGASLSESVVDENLGEIFTANKNNRIILATFASNVYRIKHIMETCRKNNRKIALFGRSMENMVDIAIKCGYFKDKSIIITAEEANHMKPSEVCLLCTGSQGEPLAALSRIASGSHRQITLMPDDVVIFSSSPKLNFFINTPVPTATVAAGVASFRSHSSILVKASFNLVTIFGVESKKQ